MKTGVLLLAGDIGGTKTKLALYQMTTEGLNPINDSTYKSIHYDSLERIVAEFLAESEAQPVVACFGIAGPVNEGFCRTTNLPWVVEESVISSQTGIPAVRLLNDLQAMALGLASLPPEELVELNPAAQSAIGNIAVIAAGTGVRGGDAVLGRANPPCHRHRRRSCRFRAQLHGTGWFVALAQDKIRWRACQL